MFSGDEKNNYLKKKVIKFLRLLPQCFKFEVVFRTEKNELASIIVRYPTKDCANIVLEMLKRKKMMVLVLHLILKENKLINLCVHLFFVTCLFYSKY